MAYKNNFINRTAFILILVWTVIIITIASVSVYNNYRYADLLAINAAKVSLEKDLAYREWGSSHGGVYVPITKETPPNQYLFHIKNRDVITNDNQHLTLMNPAYMLSQMMHNYSKLYGIKGHITSLTLLNPKNKPDKWEYNALKKIDITRKPILQKEIINNKKYIRYINPLFTKQSCLKCHAIQGYKVGDIRGAVSVSIPLKPYYKKALQNSFLNIILIIIIYIIGLITISFAKKQAKKSMKEKL